MFNASPSMRFFLLLPLLFVSQASRISQKGKGQIYMHDGAGVDCEDMDFKNQPVKVLVTRHGLSCANLIDKFSKGWVAQKMHALMKDPLLSAAGVLMTKNARTDTADWIGDKPERKVDAVLASHLARAWETAAWQYPDYEVNVVPFISESGFGKDNDPKDFDTQQVNVKRRNSDINVDLKYVQKHGQGTKGDWGNFKKFLATEFLPDLQGISKESTKPIVLAAVTHSNFMNEGEIREKCLTHYPIDKKSGKKKSNNNQVVLLHYKWTQMTCGPPNNRTTIGIMHDDEANECELVTSGTSIYNENGKTIPLCKKDVGEQCESEVQDASAWEVPTLESQMEELDRAYKKKKSQLEEAEGRVPQLQMLWQALMDNPPESKYKIRSAQKDIEKNSKLRTKLKEKMEGIAKEFNTVKVQDCWLGGQPEYTSSVIV